MFPTTNLWCTRKSVRYAFAALFLLLGGVNAGAQNAPQPATAVTAQKLSSSIHFSPWPVAFTLDSSESPARHAPETMAGGVAVFDYDRDGKPDIFFVNGAPIDTLIKNAPKYWNRLFHNNGDGTLLT